MGEKIEMQELEWIDISTTSRQSESRQRTRPAQTAARRRIEEQPLPDEEWQQRAAEERRRQMLAQERRRRMPIDNRIEEPGTDGRKTTRTAETAVPGQKGADTAKLRKKKRRRQAKTIRGFFLFTTFMLITATLFGLALTLNYIYGKNSRKEQAQPAAKVLVEEQTMPQDIREWGLFYNTPLERPKLAVDLLTINEYSRPGEVLPEVKNIFVHYTANAGTTAEQNKSYFQSLAETHERSASAHFIIGFDGVIVQCIPTAEIAYAVKERNYDSISIECCFLDESGVFTQETYRSLIELTAWLLHKYELRPEDVLRHYDEGGKNCPKYYVEHEDAWRQFLNDLETYIENVTQTDIAMPESQ